MYHYIVDYFDSIDLCDRKDSGLVAAVDYGTAVNKIVNFYGKENIFSITIEEWEDILCEDEVMEGFEEKEN